MVICEICKKELKQLSYAHLKIHNTDWKEYKERIPEAINRNKEIRDIIAEKKRGFIPWNKGLKAESNEKVRLSTEKTHRVVKEKYARGEIIHWNLGKKMSEETKRKISITKKGKKLPEGHICFKKGNINWNKGLTKETDERVRRIAEKLHNDAGNPKRKWTQERKLIFIKRMRGHPGYYHPTEEQLRQMSLRGATLKRHPISKQEIKLKEMLVKELELKEAEDFLHNKELSIENNRYKRPDFRFLKTNLIIEVDGKRWHEPSRDEIRNKKYKNQGYDTISIMAEEIQKGDFEITDYLKWRIKFESSQVGVEGEGSPR